MNRLARHGIARFVAVAILSLAVTAITGLEALTAALADTEPASAPATALLPDDDLHGPETVGAQPPRAPDVGRSGSSRSARSAALAVAAPGTVLSCVGACRRSGRSAEKRLPARGPMAWAGPGGRRAPPHTRAA